jgi:hypothetical protein
MTRAFTIPYALLITAEILQGVVEVCLSPRSFELLNLYVVRVHKFPGRAGCTAAGRADIGIAHYAVGVGFERDVVSKVVSSKVLRAR